MIRNGNGPFLSIECITFFANLIQSFSLYRIVKIWSGSNTVGGMLSGTFGRIWTFSHYPPTFCQLESLREGLTVEPAYSLMFVAIADRVLISTLNMKWMPIKVCVRTQWNQYNWKSYMYAHSIGMRMNLTLPDILTLKCAHTKSDHNFSPPWHRRGSKRCQSINLFFEQIFWNNKTVRRT